MYCYYTVKHYCKWIIVWFGQQIIVPQFVKSHNVNGFAAVPQRSGDTNTNLESLESPLIVFHINSAVVCLEMFIGHLSSAVTCPIVWYISVFTIRMQS